MTRSTNPFPVCVKPSLGVSPTLGFNFLPMARHCCHHYVPAMRILLALARGLAAVLARLYADIPARPGSALGNILPGTSRFFRVCDIREALPLRTQSRSSIANA
jgi:hypothetical protein